MTPEDPRHGQPRGYIAGCREDCCRIPRNRQLKANELRRLEGRPAFRSRVELDALLAPWLRLGLSATAVLEAAGVHARLAGEGGGPVRVATYEAVARVVEDDLKPTAQVYADLTRRRAYSLMAAGHQLQLMPIGSHGVWRTRTRVRVDLARAMRSYFREHEMRVGTSRQTASRARNAGHVPPLAWDDPDTLAWPQGASPVGLVALDRHSHALDPVVVERVLLGDRIPTTTAERREITARWLASGRPEAELCNRMGWRAGRYRSSERGVA